MVSEAKGHIEINDMLRLIHDKGILWQLRFTDTDTELVLNAALVFIGSITP